MKSFVIFFIILFFNLYSQTDTLFVSINMKNYNEVAHNKLYDFYEKERKNTDTLFSISYDFSRKYNFSELQLLSIPVFGLNDEAKEYKCGDSFERIINFKSDPYFQAVLLFKDSNKVGEFNIIEVNPIYDSIPALIPIRIEDTYVSEHLFEYKEENPDVFIFTIKNLGGLWAIKNNRLIALKETCYIHFLGLCKISESYANDYLNIISEQLIRDFANNNVRIGYLYKRCTDINKELFKEIIVKIDTK